MALSRRSILLPIACLAVFVCAPLPARASEVELLGTWHLLVHYQDAGAEDPEAEQWYDRVWTFEARGGRRLQWTEYPVAIFRDESGRFERVGRGRRGRVLGYWEPSPGQQKNIRDGLEIVSRGARSKSLRGSLERGFRSSGGLRSASTSVIGYHELWKIEDPLGKPVFEREDILGSARTENMQGVTRYETLEVKEDGRVLRGRFERDGSLTGRFRLTRAGETREHEGEEIDRRTSLDDMDLGFAVDRGPMVEELLQLLAAPDRAAQRERVRELIRGMLEQDLRDRGEEPRQYTPRVLAMTDTLETLLVDRGRSLDEVEAMLRRGEIDP